MPCEVEVTNESYGFEKDEHRYVVTVEERDGLFVPVECECPADSYNDDYACKHRVAVATIGGPVVLGAAMAYTSDESEPPLRADGGVVESDQRPDDCSCHPNWREDAPPCWPCYRDGFEEPNPRCGGRRMTRPEPTAALSGKQTGHICDQCNRGVRTGDLVRAYATYYEGDGWVLRRVWCEECGDTAIGRGTGGADEVIIEAVFWNHRLASVEERDRSRPSEGVEQ